MLLENNYPITSIFDRYGVGMISNGVINTHCIEAALNHERWIDEVDKPFMFRKLLMYLHTILVVTSPNYIKEKPDGEKT